MKRLSPLEVIAIGASVLGYVATLIAAVGGDQVTKQLNVFLFLVVVLVGTYATWRSRQRPKEPKNLTTGRFRGPEVWSSLSDPSYINRPQSASLAQKLRTHRVAILSGESGIGKSSLLRVQLKGDPTAISANTTTILIDSYVRPISTQLALELSNGRETGLVALLGMAANVVFVFDQCEQLFADPTQHEDNLDVLRDMLARRGSFKFVFSIRKEWFLDLVDFFHSLSPTVDYVHVTLDRFTSTTELDRVKTIATEAGFGDLADVWISDLSSGGIGIIPIEMQITGQIIESNRRVITSQYYRQTKKAGISDIYFNNVILKSSHKEATRLVLLALSQDRHMRRLMTFDEIRSLVQLQDDIVGSVLEELKKLGVVEELGDRFSLVHDFLATRFQAYVSRSGDAAVQEIARTMSVAWGIVREMSKTELREHQMLTADGWKAQHSGIYVSTYLLGIGLALFRLFLGSMPGGAQLNELFHLGVRDSYVDGSFVPAYIAAVFGGMYILAFFWKFMNPVTSFLGARRPKYFPTGGWAVGVIVYLVGVVTMCLHPALWGLTVGVAAALVATGFASLARSRDAQPAFRAFFNQLAISTYVTAIIVLAGWYSLVSVGPGATIAVRSYPAEMVFSIVLAVGASMNVMRLFVRRLGTLVGMVNLNSLWLTAANRT